MFSLHVISRNIEKHSMIVIQSLFLYVAGMNYSIFTVISLFIITSLLLYTIYSFFTMTQPQTILSSLQNALNLQCSICYNPFDSNQRKPIMVCQEQHIFCKTCCDQQLFCSEQNHCPQCRSIITQEESREFRHFNKIYEFYEGFRESIIELHSRGNETKKKKGGKEMKRQLDAIRNGEDMNEGFESINMAMISRSIRNQQQANKKVLFKHLHQNIQNSNLQKITENIQMFESRYSTLSNTNILHVVNQDINFVKVIYDIADSFFQKRSVDIALQFYIRLVDIQPTKLFPFLGLGNVQQIIGIYQRNIYQIYKDNQSNNRCISPYDPIALCFLINQKYSQWKDWYSKRLELDRTFVKALIGLGHLQFNHGNIEQAIKVYLQVLQVDANNQQVEQHLAFSFYEVKQYIHARQLAVNILKQGKRNMYMEFLLASTGESNQKQIQSLLQLIKHFPHYARPYNAIAQTYIALNRTSEATPYLKKAILTNPFYEKPHYILAKEYYHSQSQHELDIYAEKLFYKCIEMNPYHKKAYYYLGNIMMNNQKMQEAIQFYKQDIQLFPFFQRSYFKISQIYQQKDSPYESIFWLQKASNFLPNNQKIWLLLADIYAETPESNIAIIYYIKCIRSKYETQLVFTKLISLYESQNKLDEAIYWCEELQSLKINKQKTSIMLNKLYRKKDSTKPADTKYLPKMSYTKYIKSLK